jgi:APA family basic amino acid/polyamine antiporter
MTSVDIYGLPCNPLAPVVIMLCTLVLCVGVKESTKFNAMMTMMNLAVLSFVLAAGSTKVDAAENLTPFAPSGATGVAKGAGLVFFAYLGFDMVACL